MSSGLCLRCSLNSLALIGVPRPVPIPAAEWASWLADEAVQARYWAKVHRTSSSDCWFW